MEEEPAVDVSAAAGSSGNAEPSSSTIYIGNMQWVRCRRCAPFLVSGMSVMSHPYRPGFMQWTTDADLEDAAAPFGRVRHVLSLLAPLSHYMFVDDFSVTARCEAFTFTSTKTTGNPRASPR